VEDKMSKESDRLNELGMHNNHNLTTQGDGVYVEFSAYEARSVIPNGWTVTLVGKNLGEGWYDHGSRRFSGLKHDKKLRMKALKFASKLNNEIEWVISPFGGYISKTCADKVGVKYNKKKIIIVGEPCL
jgi:hypothetical protein